MIWGKLATSCLHECEGSRRSQGCPWPWSKVITWWSSRWILVVDSLVTVEYHRIDPLSREFEIEWQHAIAKWCRQLWIISEYACCHLRLIALCLPRQSPMILHLSPSMGRDTISSVKGKDPWQHSSRGYIVPSKWHCRSRWGEKAKRICCHHKGKHEGDKGKFEGKELMGKPSKKSKIWVGQWGNQDSRGVERWSKVSNFMSKLWVMSVEIQFFRRFCGGRYG